MRFFSSWRLKMVVEEAGKFMVIKFHCNNLIGSLTCKIIVSAFGMRCEKELRCEASFLSNYVLVCHDNS